MTIKIPLQELVDLLDFEPTKDVEAQIKATYKDVDVSVNADMVLITIDDIYTLSDKVYQHLIQRCNQGLLVKTLKNRYNIYLDYKLSSALKY